MKHPLDEVMKITDQLSLQTLTQLENLNYLGINAILYSAAIIINEQFKNQARTIPRISLKLKCHA